MIRLHTAEMHAWLVLFFFPLARILGVLAAAPPFSNPALPMRIRLLLGLALAVAVSPAVQPAPAIDPASALGLLVFAQQVLIGLAIGFSMRLVFSAIDLAGETISLQMGLGFASSYDPQTAGQTAVVSEFLGLLATLVFLSINGHLMIVATLAGTFQALPIGSVPAAGSWWALASSAAIIFSAGLLLALPIVVALLITNIALAVLSRAAPQLNLMAIGFPLTIGLGFAALAVGLSQLGAPLQELFEHGLRAMLQHVTGSQG